MGERRAAFYLMFNSGRSPMAFFASSGVMT
jgi:hypothetical protein